MEIFTTVLFSPHLPLLSEGEFKTGQISNILKYIYLITTVSWQIQDVVKVFENVPVYQGEKQHGVKIALYTVYVLFVYRIIHLINLKIICLQEY